MTAKKINIGIEAKTPEKTCTDKHCGFHGTVSLRGRLFTGEVKRLNAQRTALVEWQHIFYLPKYQRYEKRISRLQVHHPDCIQLKIGDNVRFVECRPISKTKNFVIIEKI